MKKVLFMRKHIAGINSIEELARTLTLSIPDLHLVEMPESGDSIIAIIRNIRYARKHFGDVNHIFSPSISYIAPFLKGKNIITWHDTQTMYSGRNPFKRFLKRFQRIHFPITFVSHITCISQFTLDELQSIDQRVLKKAQVIPNSYNGAFSFFPKQFNSECPVILHIGTGERKNLLRVIQALEGIKCHLWIVGKLSSEHLITLKSCNTSYTQEQDIPFSRIVELYHICDIVSFPSLYEGFGMPIIEAQATGRVVLTSHRASIPEVASNSVHYVDPTNIDDIANGFRVLIEDPGYREQLISLGRQNAQRFETKTMVKKYQDLYES